MKKLKKISFTRFELDFLYELLKQRQMLLRQHFGVTNLKDVKDTDESSYLFYIYTIETLFSKIENLKTEFDEVEISTINSVVNEWLSSSRESIKSLNHEKPSKWFDLTNKQKIIQEYHDSCFDILYKTGYYEKEKKQLFRNYLQVLNKVQESPTIFLSWLNTYEFYKIVFLTVDNEFLKIELKQRIDLTDLSFIQNKKSLDELADSFTKMTNRVKAKELISKANPDKYPDDNIPFIKKALTDKH